MEATLYRQRPRTLEFQSVRNTATAGMGSHIPGRVSFVTLAGSSKAKLSARNLQVRRHQKHETQEQ